MIVSILHISDLHRDPRHYLTNAALLASLERDREHYTREDPIIKPPDLVFVSGDLVSGVQPTNPDAGTELARQYMEAEAFLSGLAEHFFHGDRERVIVTPGNHDISYPNVHASLRKINLAGSDPTSKEDTPPYAKMLYSPISNIRWSWRELCFYEIADLEVYNKRLEAFANFYSRFYSGSRKYQLDPENQFDLFDYPDFGITAVAFNSCHNSDPLNCVANIHADCIARATRILKDSHFHGRLRVAVWHHSTSGPPAKVDYLDSDTLQVFIDCGFSLGFHGHQHKPQFIDERFRFGEEGMITVISAGTLCGGHDVLPPGQPRSYNMILIDTEQRAGRLHLRQMQNPGSDSPIWGPGFFPSSRKTFIEFRIQPPPDFMVDRKMFILVEAEEHLSNGRPGEAIRLARPLAHTNGLARRILLEAFTNTDDSKGIIQFFYPPISPAEIIHVANALFQEDQIDRLREMLNNPAVRDSTDPNIVEVRRIYSKRI